MDNQTDEMEGIQIGDAVNFAVDKSSSIPLPLSSVERQILDLYDQLEEILLEVHLLQAQQRVGDVTIKEVSETDIKNAQDELLHAKAQYALRNAIVESTLMANPVLKAVHAGEKASIIERDLLPMIEARDAISVSLTQSSSKATSLREKLISIEAEHVTAAKKNATLAETMIRLAENASSRKREDIQDSKVREQVEELEESLQVSRQRWRIMKGTISAVVAGSGLDWARDATLRELVLENDSDEE